jgi:hypothetical protein
MVAAAVAESAYAPPSNNAVLAAVQSLQASVQSLQASVNTLQANVNVRFTTLEANVNSRFATLEANVNSRFAMLELQVANLNARAANDGVSESSDVIAPLRNDDGDLPPLGMPTTVAQLCALTGDGLTPLLVFYGLPVAGRVHQKKKRLARYLGVRTVHDLLEAS